MSKLTKTSTAVATALCLAVMAMPTALADTPPTTVNLDIDGDGTTEEVQVQTKLLDFSYQDNAQYCGVVYNGGEDQIRFKTIGKTCPQVFGMSDLDGDGNDSMLMQWPFDDGIMQEKLQQAPMLEVGADGESTEYLLKGTIDEVENTKWVFDHNGDGKQDIVVLLNDWWRVFVNQGDGTFKDNDLSTDQVAWGDFNGNGAIDGFFTASWGHGSMATVIYHNNRNWRLEILMSEGRDCSVKLYDSIYNPLAGVKDVNGDGIDDIQVVKQCAGGEPETVTLYNNDDGNFTPAEPEDETPGVPGGEQGDDYVSNRPSKALDDAVVFIEGRFEKADINVMSNDDLNASWSTIQIIEQPTVGTASVTYNGNIRYDRTGKGDVPDQLKYKLTDVRGNVSTAVVNIKTHPSDKSLALNDRVEMFENRFEKADINVLDNDVVIADNPVVKLIKEPKMGTAEVLDNGRIRYDRTGTFSGDDEFTYGIVDADGSVTEARVAIDWRIS